MSPRRSSARAFTLIELLAVVVVILVLAAIGMGVTGYVQRRLTVNNAKAQLTAMEAALESYKSDWGYYPLTGVGRFSSNQACEGSNNLALYRALSGLATGGKRYMSFPTGMLRTNLFVTTNSVAAMSIVDPWGTLYNYYCSPSTPFALSNNFYGYPTNVNYNNGLIVGGQVNVASFDLFSYGPDRLTFGATNLATGSWSDGPWTTTNYKNPANANDDITNWK